MHTLLNRCSCLTFYLFSYRGSVSPVVPTTPCGAYPLLEVWCGVVWYVCVCFYFFFIECLSIFYFFFASRSFCPLLKPSVWETWTNSRKNIISPSTSPNTTSYMYTVCNTCVMARSVTLFLPPLFVMPRPMSQNHVRRLASSMVRTVSPPQICFSELGIMEGVRCRGAWIIELQKQGYGGCRRWKLAWPKHRG